MIDSFGDGWNGASWTLKEAGGEVVVAGPYTFSSGASATQVFTWTAAPTAAPTVSPTAVPTNIGDTHIPTASPTTAPTDAPTTAAPTDAPTASPTSAPPTAAPTSHPTTTDGPPIHWAWLKSHCESSVCDAANGGCIIVLSDDFIMGSYSSEILFADKRLCHNGKWQDT
jgi:hypothetical protein